MLDEKLLSSLAQKDAEFLEKLMRKILEAGIAHWAAKTNEVLDASPMNPGPEYARAFNQWHLLRQCQQAIDAELASPRDRNQETP